MQRRHDIDAVRVLAFGLLILYHVGMVYVAGWDFHLKSPYQSDWLQWPMVFVNRWRMPLLFLISGIAVALVRAERAPLRFALQRSWRLLLPLAFGMMAIVPVQAYCEARGLGTVAPGFGVFMLRYWQVRPWPPGTFTGAEFGITWNHLWYLPYLWVYTMLLLALLPLLQSRAGERLQTWCSGAGLWATLVLPPLWYALSMQFVAPRFPSTHALVGDWFMHAEFLPVFLAGYAIGRSDAAWAFLQRQRWPLLAWAAVGAVVYFALKIWAHLAPEGTVPPLFPLAGWKAISLAAQSVYAWFAMLAILAWGRALLDRPFRWLPYATEAVFPWYVLHQSLIIVLAYALMPLQLGPVAEPLLVVLGTVAGCLLLHELLIRRIGWLRPLFGLKRAVPASGDGHVRRSGAIDPPLPRQVHQQQ